MELPEHVLDQICQLATVNHAYEVTIAGDKLELSCTSSLPEFLSAGIRRKFSLLNILEFRTHNGKRIAVFGPIKGQINSCGLSIRLYFTLQTLAYLVFKSSNAIIPVMLTESATNQLTKRVLEKFQCGLCSKVLAIEATFEGFTVTKAPTCEHTQAHVSCAEQRDECSKCGIIPCEQCAGGICAGCERYTCVKCKCQKVCGKCANPICKDNKWGLVKGWPSSEYSHYCTTCAIDHYSKKDNSNYPAFPYWDEDFWTDHLSRIVVESLRRVGKENSDFKFDYYQCQSSLALCALCSKFTNKLSFCAGCRRQNVCVYCVVYSNYTFNDYGSSGCEELCRGCAEYQPVTISMWVQRDPQSGPWYNQ